jgi:hypothetical protein
VYMYGCIYTRMLLADCSLFTYIHHCVYYVFLLIIMYIVFLHEVLRNCQRHVCVLGVCMFLRSAPFVAHVYKYAVRACFMQLIAAIVYIYIYIYM